MPSRIPQVPLIDERRPRGSKWEASAYAVFAAPIAAACAACFLPDLYCISFFAFLAAASAGLAWLSLDWLSLRQRRKPASLKRMLDIGCLASVYFTILLAPLWGLIRGLTVLFLPDASITFIHGFLGFVMIFGIVIAVPLAFAASIVGSALYWLLRSLVLLGR